MSFAEIEHQDHAVRSLQQAIGRQRIPHAYVFHGPDGVGKEKVAMGLAQIMLCAEPLTVDLPGDRAAALGVDRLRTGCGRCEDCRSVLAGSHPDLHLIYRQLNRKHPEEKVRKRKGLEILIDVVRHFVVARVGHTAVRGQAKVFIVREADRMNEEAQNALLKTLEEPQGATVIVLLVTSLDRLLPTTLSRCQVVRFDALPTEFVRRKVAELRPDRPADQLDWNARYADGSVGAAVQNVDDDLYNLNASLSDGFLALCGAAGRERPAAGNRTTGSAAGETANPAAWIEASKTLGERYRKLDPDITDTEAGRRGLRAIFRLAATWYADLLRCVSGETAGLVNVGAKAMLERAAVAADRSDLIGAINRIAQAEHHLDLNANTQLVVETLLNDLASTSRRRLAPSPAV